MERLEVRAREEVGRKKQLPDASTSEDELTTKQLSYLTARKSLINGPVEPTEVEVRMFFLTKMQMDQEIAEEIAIVDIKKYHDRKVPPHRRRAEEAKQGKVKVIFEEINDRDAVLSHAYLLDEGSNLDVVIPEFLEPLHRHLESHAYRIRKNARESGTNKISTQIRLRDENMSLVLPLKDSKENVWNTFTREELKDSEDSNKRTEPSRENTRNE